MSRRAPTTIWRWVNLPFLTAIWGYRLTLSPLMSGHCRFDPTCSAYALEAYRLHNPAHATWLTLVRVLRCHPFGGSGWDPVPPPGPAALRRRR